MDLSARTAALEQLSQETGVPEESVIAETADVEVLGRAYAQKRQVTVATSLREVIRELDALSSAINRRKRDLTELREAQEHSGTLKLPPVPPLDRLREHLSLAAQYGPSGSNDTAVRASLLTRLVDAALGGQWLVVERDDAYVQFLIGEGLVRMERVPHRRNIVNISIW